VKFRFIEAEKGKYPVTVMCEVMNVSRSAYYRWLRTRKLPDRRLRADEHELRKEIIRIHRSSRGTYGRQRIQAELRARGRNVNAKCVRRILVEEGLRGRGRRPRRRIEHSEAEEPSPNVLDRKFVVSAPNQVWVGDITCIEIAERYWYLAVVLDLFSRRVVGWHLADHVDAGLVVKALRNAVDRRRPGRGVLLFHSDQGIQYRSARFRRLLRIFGIAQSMSRRGNCWDNAPMEAFFATLKLEHIDLHEWTDCERVRARLREYITYYNNRRRHSTLDYRTPQQYEAA